MREIVFWSLVASLLFSNATLIFSIARPDLRLWPPPDRSSRRFVFTRIGGLLAPLSLLGVLALGPLDGGSARLALPGRFALGGLLFAGGGAFALWGYFGLGVDASQGRHEGLVASGAYRYSRNPQYVGTIVCLLGYALAWSSGLTLVVWLLWSAWFILAPFAEEPWLREQAGASFDEYAAVVPRYFGFPRRRPGRAPSLP